MAGIARSRVEMSVTGPLGIVGPLTLFPAIAVVEWFGPSTVEVADGVSGQAVAVIDAQGLTTVTALMITSDQDIAVSYGGGTAIALLAGHVHLLSGTSLTAMAITNASGFTANVTYLLAGT